MRYNVGDKVRIKSLDWYNKNKTSFEGTNFVDCGRGSFTDEMVKYCNEVVTIESIDPYYGCYFMKEDGAKDLWTDEMIECKEETKPELKFKVGDKVKDKNNRVWFIVRVSETFFDISSVPNAQGYFVPIDNQDDYELAP
jgi:hypothetical protein